jgi:predicted nucleic acid-binding Zn ribbon protein
MAISPKTNNQPRDANMHSIIYLVGLVVVVMFVLSLLGLH